MAVSARSEDDDPRDRRLLPVDYDWRLGDDGSNDELPSVPPIHGAQEASDAIRVDGILRFPLEARAGRVGRDGVVPARAVKRVAIGHQWSARCRDDALRVCALRGEERATDGNEDEDGRQQNECFHLRQK